MALDFGDARIGVAVTDPLGMLAQPLETIHCKRPAEPAALDRIATLVAELDVGQIVVGLPLQLDGRAGDQAERTRKFAHQVEARTGLPVDYIDERWTSREAERALREAGLSARKQRGRVDPVAAALILRAWLDQKGAG